MTADTITDALHAAAGHHRAGRFSQAESVLRGVLAREPGNPQALHLLGLMAYQAGKFDDALRLVEGAISGAADNPAFHTNLGLIYEAQGRFSEAVAAHERALGLRPDYVQAAAHLGQALAALGDQEGAERAYRKALDLGAGAVAWNGLGSVLKATGREDDAVAAYRKAIGLTPDFAEAHAGLGLALFDEGDPGPAAACLEEALRLKPRFGLAAFYLAVIRDLENRADAAEELFRRAAGTVPNFDQLKDSWDYVKERRDPSTRLLTNVFETLGFALERTRVEGLNLEFGVRFGISTRFLASRVTGEVHAFDSFEGLPESWGHNPAGVYSTSGRLPEVPSNVRLHVGWFAETLPGFVAANQGPVRFMNVDCDIYSSTKTVLDHLADRIVPGSVIVFDEYIMTDAWREDEFKAFQEAVDRYGWRYRYLAFSLITRQAVVEIL